MMEINQVEINSQHMQERFGDSKNQYRCRHSLLLNIIQRPFSRTKSSYTSSLLKAKATQKKNV
jgi:hypothetical protein